MEPQNGGKFKRFLTVKGKEPSVHLTEVSVLQSNLFNTHTKGTEPSVRFTEVSVLQSNLLNTDTKGTVPSVHITEVSVLQSNLLNPFAPEPPVTAPADPGPFYPL